jgi:hypothetical protein
MLGKGSRLKKRMKKEKKKTPYPLKEKKGKRKFRIRNVLRKSFFDFTCGL